MGRARLVSGSFKAGSRNRWVGLVNGLRTGFAMPL
jgi:hypothetical protein